MTIYIDEYFLINFYIDLLVITVAAKIRNTKIKIVRILFGALTGAIYSCVSILFDIKNGIIELFITYIVMSFIITWISFGFIGKEHLSKNIVVLFVTTFIFCGIINGFFTKNIIKNNFELIVVATLTAFASMGLNRLFRSNLVANGHFCDVVIIEGNREIRVKALVDTGNSLFEPISKRPVSVVRNNIADKLKIDNIDEKGAFVIPYRSVGKADGILMGYRADKMKIIYNDKTVMVDKPILAVYKGFFSDKNEYDMLLHPKIISEGDNNV